MSNTKSLYLAKPHELKKRRRDNHVRRNATRSRARMIRDLDRIARQEVFGRDGSCIFAGMFAIKCSSVLQWCHVMSRRHLCLRWEPENSFVGCSGHHFHWHNEPGLVVPKFAAMYPERMKTLELVLRVNPKMNVRELWEARCQTQS